MIDFSMRIQKADETPVEMYLMEVEEVLEDWQESGWRKREILPLAEAKLKVRGEF